MKNKYHVHLNKGHEEGFKHGFRQSIGLAITSGENSVLIRIGNLDNAKGILLNLLGETLNKSLIKNRIISFKIDEYNKIDIFLETDKTAGKSGFEIGVALLPWGTTHALNNLLADYRVTTIVYTPWAESEWESYLQDHPDSTET